MNKKFAFIAFVVVALVQLYVPASMILGREVVLAKGKEYKFRTAPVDPNDPFRGKYMVLDFLENRITVSDLYGFKTGDYIYAVLTIDSSGYAHLNSVSKTKPAANTDFVKVKIASINKAHLDAMELFIEYPFERYYMSESKVDDATVVYQESVRDTNQVVYAVVKIKDGDAVLKDVMIDGVSIKAIERKKNNN